MQRKKLRKLMKRELSELGVENCADILMHYFEKLEYI